MRVASLRCSPRLDGSVCFGTVYRHGFGKLQTHWERRISQFWALRHEQDIYSVSG